MEWNVIKKIVEKGNSENFPWHIPLGGPTVQ